MAQKDLWRELRRLGLFVHQANERIIESEDLRDLAALCIEAARRRDSWPLVGPPEPPERGRADV